MFPTFTNGPGPMQLKYPKMRVNFSIAQAFRQKGGSVETLNPPLDSPLTIYDKYLDVVEDHLDRCFPNIELLDAFSIFDGENWPDMLKLYAFGHSCRPFHSYSSRSGLSVSGKCSTTLLVNLYHCNQ